MSTTDRADVLMVRCPTCRAPVGQPCSTFRRRRGMCGRGFGTGAPTAPHAARVGAAQPGTGMRMNDARHQALMGDADSLVEEIGRIASKVRSGDFRPAHSHIETVQESLEELRQRLRTAADDPETCREGGYLRTAP